MSGQDWPTPPEIDWNLTPDEQAWRIYQAIAAVEYPSADLAPKWPDLADLAEVPMQRAIVSVFGGRASPWRADPIRKYRHTRGAVALFELEAVPGASAEANPGSVLAPGRSRLVVGRYSRAGGPRRPEPWVAGVALKLPRERAPAVDVLMLTGDECLGSFSTVWKQLFATRIHDPASWENIPIDDRRKTAELLRGLDAISRAVDAPDTVKPYRLPLPRPMRSGRIMWSHTPRARALLELCGDTPFADPRGSALRRVQESMDGDPWAELYYRPEIDDLEGPRPSELFARATLRAPFCMGPYGDLHLHFTHPGVQP